MDKPTEKSFSGGGSQTTPTREEIELRAYQIHVERGATHGRDVEDWLQAERELVEEKYGKPVQKAKAAGA
jgi:hypothetical protein